MAPPRNKLNPMEVVPTKLKVEHVIDKGKLQTFHNLPDNDVCRLYCISIFTFLRIVGDEAPSKSDGRGGN